MTAYEVRISDWSSDVCSSDLVPRGAAAYGRRAADGLAEETGGGVAGGSGGGCEASGATVSSCSSSEKRSSGCHSRAPACQASVSRWIRSEEHTSELQSLMRISYAVFCLKKKIKTHKT